MSRYKVSLLPAQRKFLELPEHLEHTQKDVACYQGGYGSGKTFCGALLGCILCLKYPGIIGLCGAYTFTLVRDTTLEMYKEHLDNLGEKYTYNEQKGILYFSNGSKILFRHFDDPDSLKSLSVGFIELEEMSEVPESTFAMLLGRLRQPVKPEWGDRFIYRIFGHTNPQGQKGWIYEYFKKNPRKNYRRIIAPTVENKYLPADFVDGLKEAYDDKYYAINVLGEDDDNINNLAVKGFNPDIQVVDTLTINNRYPLHLTCDFNVDPMCWYLCQDYGDMTYILYEFVVENTTTADVANLVIEVLGEKYRNFPLIINGDASGNNRTTKGIDFSYLKTELYRAGFNNIKLEVLKKNPAIEERMLCFNNWMQDSQGKHHIQIHPQCKWFIYNLENVEIKEGTSKPKIPSTGELKRNPKAKYLIHPIDAVGYLIYYYHRLKHESPWANYNSNQQGIDVFGGKYDKRLE